MRFSQRIGKTPVREKLQVGSMDERLENRLWNTVLNYYIASLSTDHYHGGRSDREKFYIHLWCEFLGKRADEIPKDQFDSIHLESVRGFLKKWFFNYTQWFEKYDLVEELSRLNLDPTENFVTQCNIALKKEATGYRIIDRHIVQVTKEEEIVEIEDALANTSKWDSVNTHLNTAIEYFSNRENPDYRNSVKEAISAVESLCVIIVGEKSATLGQALGKIEKNYPIHGALKASFSSLYGYTSAAGGIRHGLEEGDIEILFEDAKYMLISCSAFINYLIVKFES